MPHSDLGHRRRATYQWRSKRRFFKGGEKGMVGGTKGCGLWRETKELTRGRGLFPPAWRGLERSGGLAPWEFLLTTPLKYQGNSFLDIKILPFLDRKEQLRSLLQSYLPMH